MNKLALPKDKDLTKIAAYITDKLKVQEPVTIAAGSSVTFGYDASCDYNITGYVALLWYSDGKLTRWLGSDTTKTRTVPAQTETIFMLDTAQEKITLKNNTAVSIVLEIEGM